MRVVPEKQLPDGPSKRDVVFQYLIVFALGILVGGLLIR